MHLCERALECPSLLTTYTLYTYKTRVTTMVYEINSQDERHWVTE